MRSKLIKSLVCVGVILASAAMMGGEAWAACTQWRSIGGSAPICVAWKTGSEVCTEIIKSYSGSICPSGGCGIAECTVFGTFDLGIQGSVCNTDPGTLDPNCGIVGFAYCKNPAYNSSHAQGQPFTLPGIEGSIANVKDCDKKGKCTVSIELDPTNTSSICINPNWHFVTFTASEFKGEACFCPGGYAADGTTCCADHTRIDGSCGVEYGTGASRGTPICIREYCTADLSTYDPITNFSLPYTCDPETVVTCGGITGNLCQ